MPASESTLLLFATQLVTFNISYAIIKIYFSAIRHTHVTAGMHSLFNDSPTPAGAKRYPKEPNLLSPTRMQLPVTIQIMENILQLLSQRTKSYMNVMTWAAFNLAFLRLLQVSEFTVPSDEQFDQACYMCLGDNAVKNQENLQMLQVKIRQSKTDPFHKGANIFLGTIRRGLCPIRGILPYL